MRVQKTALRLIPLAIPKRLEWTTASEESFLDRVLRFWHLKDADVDGVEHTWWVTRALHLCWTPPTCDDRTLIIIFVLWKLYFSEQGRKVMQWVRFPVCTDTIVDRQDFRFDWVKNQRNICETLSRKTLRLSVHWCDTRYWYIKYYPSRCSRLFAFPIQGAVSVRVCQAGWYTQ